MDKDRVDGIGLRVKGMLKESLGRMIGDAKLTSDGAKAREEADAIRANTPEEDQVLGVDMDRIKGVGHQLTGALRKGLGVIIGDQKLQDEGTAELGRGKTQNVAGSARDEAREAVDAAHASDDPTKHS